MVRNRLGWVFVTLVVCCPTAAAQGLVINPTFDTTITSDPNAATIMSTINQVIQVYRDRISTPITVNITFREMSGGLGQSSTTIGNVSYTQYRAALVTHANPASPTDTAVLANLPVQTNNPANNDPNVQLSFANRRALGFSAVTSSDGTVFLNTSIMNLSRASINPNKFDLFSVAAHEINEVLGLGSNLDGSPNNPPTTPAGPVAPMDLFRYDQNGNRTYTTNANTPAFFSVDGTTRLVQFNQDDTGDRGDWFSPGGQTPRVQDAFATAGATPDLGVELTALDAIGYNLTPVPEPASAMAVLAAACAAGVVARRRRA